jgi:hypothetical protein
MVTQVIGFCYQIAALGATSIACFDMVMRKMVVRSRLFNPAAPFRMGPKLAGVRRPVLRTRLHNLALRRRGVFRLAGVDVHLVGLALPTGKPIETTISHRCTYLRLEEVALGQRTNGSHAFGKRKATVSPLLFTTALCFTNEKSTIVLSETTTAIGVLRVGSVNRSIFAIVRPTR